MFKPIKQPFIISLSPSLTHHLHQTPFTPIFTAPITKQHHQWAVVGV